MNVPIFDGFSLGNPTKKVTASKIRVALSRLSEYSSVAYLVDRWES